MLVIIMMMMINTCRNSTLCTHPAKPKYKGMMIIVLNMVLTTKTPLPVWLNSFSRHWRHSAICKGISSCKEMFLKIVFEKTPFYLKMWPTWLQGTISRVPPHIQVLKLWRRTNLVFLNFDQTQSKREKREKKLCFASIPNSPLPRCQSQSRTCLQQFRWTCLKRSINASCLH